MEGLPTVLSVVDSGGGGGVQENLAFAVSEENGLNYGYIIHLPVDVAMQQEILGNVLADQNHLIVHQGQVENKNSQQSTIYLPVVTTTTSVNNCGDTDTTTTQTTSGEVIHNPHPPIEFQYHLEEIPSAFVDGQVEVQMSAEVDVKYDTLNFTSVQFQQELNQHVNLSEGDLVSEILSDSLPTSITNTAHQQISQVQPSNSPVVSKPSTTTTSVKAYGKPKPVSKVVSEVSSKTISQPTKSSSSSLKVTKVSQVSVTQSERVKVLVPVRKRRLIIDAQRQIPIPEFKRQLLNTKDIVHVRSELAPSTKKAMKCLELGGVVQFFSTPGRAIRNVHLSRLFTNNLVMVSSNSVGHVSFSNVVPLNADLRVPSVEVEEDDSNFNYSKGHTSNSNVPSASSAAHKRLTTVSRPLECIFKGLRKPPVFKEYKKIQRKHPEKMNGSSLKSFHNRQRSKVKEDKVDKKVEDKQEDLNKIEMKVEEVVYTVVEEEGESMVRKSTDQEEVVNSDDPSHGHDPLLLELKQEVGLKKESCEVENNSDNLVFSDCTSSFSIVNGENEDNDNGEDDLNKLLWSEQVSTSS